MKQFCVAFLLVLCHSAHAADLTWDANGTGSGQTDGSGDWLTIGQWWNGSANATWNNGDNASIGLSGAGGTITLGTVTAGTVAFNSFTGTYTLTGGSLAVGSSISAAAGSEDVIIQSPLYVSGDISINSSGVDSQVAIQGDLIHDGGGNKRLTLGGANANINTIGANLTNAPGAVLDVYMSTAANGDKWGLSGSNTYSGQTYVNKGTLVIQGKEALSTNSYVYLRGVSSSKGNISFLDDGVGTITFTTEIEKFEIQTSAGGNVSFFVGNNSVANGGVSSGTTTGSTIAIGPFYVNGDARVRDMDVSVTAANDYRLQFNDVLFQANYNTEGWPCYFIPTTAKVTLSGTITQRNGNSQGTSHRVGLSGTSSGNLVDGVIADAADYTSGANTNARAMGLLKTSSSEWTLAGMNTFTGPTEINGGTLILDGPFCLSDEASLTMSGSGDLHINDGEKEKVGSLYFGAVQQTNGTWGATTSRAQNKNDTYFSGDGVLYVGIDLPAIGTLIILD